jgi:hypothetical protein
LLIYKKSIKWEKYITGQQQNMKPKIRLLQKFANPYFRRGKCPLVRWKAKKKLLGIADTENNRIYLNPKISKESSWRYFITDNFQALGERIGLFEGEQFFMILLFQIKFFKIKLKAKPEEWITTKQHIKFELNF